MNYFVIPIASFETRLAPTVRHGRPRTRSIERDHVTGEQGRHAALTHAPGHMPRDTHPSSSISPGTPHRCLGSSARPLSVHVEKNHPHTDTFTSSSTFTPRAQSVCTGQSKSASYFACPPPRAHSTRPPAPPGLGLAVDRLPGVPTPTACAAPGRRASPPGSNGVKTCAVHGHGACRSSV